MRKVPSAKIMVSKSEPWIKDSPFESNLYHSISLLLPRYEYALMQYVCEAGFPKSGGVFDESVRLLQQENVHRRVHIKYNERMEKAGYAIWPILKLADLNSMIMSNAPRSIKLGISAAGEHLTAIIGVYFKENYERYCQGSDEATRELWHWHAIEELEHKSAAFDLCRHHNVGYFMRFVSFLFVSLWLIAPMLILGTVMLSIQDRSIFKPVYWKNFIRTMFAKGGLNWAFAAGVASYFKPGFHPSELQVDDIIEAYDKKFKATIEDAM